MLSSKISATKMATILIFHRKRVFLSLLLFALFLVLYRSHLRHNDLNETAVFQFEKLMLSRTKKMKLMCNQMRSNPRERFTQNFNLLYFLPERQFLWCPVFKAASTTWMENVFNIANISMASKEEILGSIPRGLNPSDVARKVATPISSASDLLAAKKLYPKLKTFMIVRHPFHRLVSSFRDKLERLHSRHIEDDYYYNSIGKEITARYRRLALNKFGEEYFSPENNLGAILPNSKRKKELPIFWEFIRYIIDNPTEELDVHWTPAYRLCSVCSISYDAVIKFENFETEEVALHRYLGLDHLLKKPRILNKRDSNLSDEEITRLYILTLSKEELRLLYEVYKTEFEMFGYTWEGME